MKLIKPFRGVPNGEFYPIDYAKGDDCPKELEEAAREAGALPNKESKRNQAELPKSPANDDNPPKQDDGEQSNNGENGDTPDGEQPNDGTNSEQS